jgi:predicted acylesterase/phospholipase RssA
MINYVDTLCIGGGGTIGISFIGCIDILEEQSWFSLKNIKIFVGASIGSLLSFLFVLGYSNSEVKEFILRFDLNKIEPKTDCINLFSNHGLDHGNNIIEIVKTFLKEKLGVREITFNELYKSTGKVIKIVVTNYTKSKTEVLDHLSHPDMSVLLALRMSISIPLIFTPVNYNNCYYIDGGLLKNFPIDLCNPETTIGLASVNYNENKLGNLLEYINGICQIFFNIENRRFCNYKYNFIKVYSDVDEFINLSFDNNKKYHLINKGKEAVNEFIDHTEVKNIINDMITHIEK